MTVFKPAVLFVAVLILMLLLTACEYEYQTVRPVSPQFVGVKIEEMEKDGWKLVDKTEVKRRNTSGARFSLRSDTYFTLTFRRRKPLFD